jgi:hypothetical protein
MNHLIKTVEEAIVRNDNYDALRAITTFLEWTEDETYELDIIESEHSRVGHLKQDLKNRRDRFRKIVKSEFLKKYSLSQWDDLRI